VVKERSREVRILSLMALGCAEEKECGRFERPPDRLIGHRRAII
jgi:hypothetical protein